MALTYYFNHETTMGKFKIAPHQRGIGLLELMLALAIIGVLIMMAARYFEGASHALELNLATTQILEIEKGLYNWREAKGDYSELFTSNGPQLPETPATPLQALANAGYITQEVASKGPFDNSSFQIIGTADAVSITLKGLTTAECQNLLSKTNNSAATCDSGTLTIPIE
jgi:prepilin-type N-terminal cleavage/methylation domain-containing protein